MPMEPHRFSISRRFPTARFLLCRPFSPGELKTYFGTDRPTRADVEQSEEYWEDLERGQARYAVVYANNAPSEIYFAGYSFD